jgi:hypothetical protein
VEQLVEGRLALGGECGAHQPWPTLERRGEAQRVDVDQGRHVRACGDLRSDDRPIEVLHVTRR